MRPFCPWFWGSLTAIFVKNFGRQIFLVSRAADVNAYKSWSFEKAENKKKRKPCVRPQSKLHVFSWPGTKQPGATTWMLVHPPWEGLRGGRSRARGGLDAPGARHQSAGSSVWRKSRTESCSTVCVCIDQVDIYCTTDVNSSPLQG